MLVLLFTPKFNRLQSHSLTCVFQRSFEHQGFRYYWHNISQISFDAQQAAKEEEHGDGNGFFLFRYCLSQAAHNINT